jgi:hypothetical protein
MFYQIAIVVAILTPTSRKAQRRQANSGAAIVRLCALVDLVFLADITLGSLD